MVILSENIKIFSMLSRSVMHNGSQLHTANKKGYLAVTSSV